MISFKQIKAFRRRGAHDKAGMLECILCAGYWLNERVAEAFPGESSLCDRCDWGVPATPLHAFWECPANAKSEQPEVLHTNHLIAEATEQHEHPACLWLRGLLPLHLVASIIPAIPPRRLRFLGTPPPFGFPSGLY